MAKPGTILKRELKIAKVKTKIALEKLKPKISLGIKKIRKRKK